MKWFTSYFAVLISIIILSCGGDTNPSSLLLGSIVGDWSNKINAIIQNAQNSGLILEVTAAAQAKNLVEQVRITYDGELDKTVDAFSAGEQKTFDDITEAIDGLAKGSTNAITNLGDVVSMLPGMNLTPQIKECVGNIIAPNQENYSMVLYGGFWNIGDKGYTTSLTINDSIIQPIVKQMHEIEFKIPKSLLKTPISSIEYIPCEINIDYQKTKLLIFDSKHTATFSQKLIVLPPKFGKVVMETTALQDSTFVEVDKECGPYVWSSKDGNNHNEILGCDMENGWSCDIASVHGRLLYEEGRKNVDWFDQGNMSSSGRAQWKMLTTPKSGWNGRDGVVHIQLIYNRYLTKKVDVIKKNDSIELNWGNKIVLDIPRNAIWKLKFEKYDGNTFEIASTKQNSSLIKLDNIRDRQISLQVVPFNNL